MSRALLMEEKMPDSDFVWWSSDGQRHEVSRMERSVKRERGLGRRRRPCGQLNDFVRGFNAVIHGYSDYRVAFLNDHSSRFGSFSRRV